MTYLFSDDELERLARPPRQCIIDAAADAATELHDEVAFWERRFRRGLKGFAAWAEGSVNHLHQTSGGSKAVAQTLGERSWSIAIENGVTGHDLRVLQQRHASIVENVFVANGPEAAVQSYDQVEGAYRRLHDARRDLVSALWTTLLDLAGRDALERCLRTLATSSLMDWMDVDLEESPEARLVEWSAVMRANFSSIEIDEGDDRFTITSDPCGSCTRQLIDGRATALELAEIEPFGPEHVGLERVPIYRSHVGLMHWLMPLERIGAPWPIVQCPRGAGTGPCTLVLRKAPG